MRNPRWLRLACTLSAVADPGTLPQSQLCTTLTKPTSLRFVLQTLMIPPIKLSWNPAEDDDEAGAPLWDFMFLDEGHKIKNAKTQLVRNGEDNGYVEQTKGLPGVFCLEHAVSFHFCCCMSPAN